MVLFLTKTFGWAKPVPINFANLSHHKYSVALVSVAGSLSNLVLAFMSFLLYKFIFYIHINIDTDTMLSLFLFQPLLLMINASILVNVMLTFSNLLPIMPLNGAKIVSNFLPHYLATKYESTGRHGVKIIAILFLSGQINNILSPPVNFIYKTLMDM